MKIRFRSILIALIACVLAGCGAFPVALQPDPTATCRSAFDANSVANRHIDGNAATANRDTDANPYPYADSNANRYPLPAPANADTRTADCQHAPGDLQRCLDAGARPVCVRGLRRH
jgi:hypothetical protein